MLIFVKCFKIFSYEKVFCMVESMRRLAPWLLSCLPFRVRFCELYTEQGSRLKRNDYPAICVNRMGIRLLKCCDEWVQGINKLSRETKNRTIMVRFFFVVLF